MNETKMAREIREIPEVARRQLSQAGAAYGELGARLRRLDPAVLVTAARGSSDHAATYLKYLVETHVGCPVASVGPSVASVYKRPLRLRGSALIAISQSGASPDLLSLIDAGREGGAFTAALVNAEDAPARQHAEFSAPLLAGPEVSVAATKSYLASLIASAAIVAGWSQDQDLLKAIERLPGCLEEALTCNWSGAEEHFARPGPVFCVGRGMGLSIAYESALKFKETCGLHAEGYSSAEVLHGPVALAATGLRALLFIPSDESRPGVLATAQRLQEAGVDAWMVDDRAGADRRLPVPDTGHPALVPLCQAVAFYVFVERLARRLGRDPDNPVHLKKVTRTV